jgi:hypothetical protein
MSGNDLAVVVPVVNEFGNVQPLIDELYKASLIDSSLGVQ